MYAIRRILFAFTFYLVGFVSTLPADDRPNILLLLCDDIGAHELGIYGHPQHKTPNLDKLATSGIYFETGYATPICHPTRFQIMTGQYGHHNGVFHFPGRPGGPPKSGEGADNIASHLTIGKVFQQAGYATAHCGKWQLSGEHPDLIVETGFDEYCMWAYKHNLPPGSQHDGLYEGGTKTARYWHPSIVQNGKKLPTTIDSYGPDIFADFAIDFARRNKDESPFFIYYPMALVHSPYWPTPDDNPADGVKNERAKSNWQSNVEYTDKIVGKLVDALEDLGERDNTLIMFIGDNGTGGNGKGRTTELGCRVPFILNGPNIVKGTGACRELVDISDILPTCCDVAGVQLPTDAVIDGVSFKSYLQGDMTPLREWTYQYLGVGRVVRTKRWLLENNTMQQFGQLYDCGISRNGAGYVNVTESTEPEVLAAKEMMKKILADKPVPDVRQEQKAKKGANRKKNKRRSANN